MMKKMKASILCTLFAFSPIIAQADIPAVGNGSAVVVYPLVNRVAFNGTSLTQSAYTTLASPSLTLGTSYGPTGAWDVEVTMQVEVNTASANIQTCIEGSSAGTNAAGSYDQNSGTVCNNTVAAPTNPLAGSNTTGSSAVRVATVKYAAQYPNGATVGFNCAISIGATAGLTAGGYCIERAIPI